MSLFEKYDKCGKEDSFREDFVKPLLNRMGFVAVVETHGIGEFGKDFVFAEPQKHPRIPKPILGLTSQEQLFG